MTDAHSHRPGPQLDADFERLLAAEFPTVLPETGPDKRMDLGLAIERFIKPGQTIHLASTHNRPYRLAAEIARQHWGQDPEFTFSCLNLGESLISLILSGVLKRGITTFAGDVWPYPSPNPVINQAWLSGDIELEHWSILSLTQRLMAGALGLPFAPTRSLAGSSMAADNPDYIQIPDPFGGPPAGLVSAYKPDICLIHVPACDCSGNAILTPPLGEGPLGVFAASAGTILSTERIVDTNFLRQHSHLVRIPADQVVAVVEYPFGAHPRGQTNIGLPTLTQYADDYGFLNDVRVTSRKDSPELDKWTDRWVRACQTPDDFREQLGTDRINLLQTKADAEGWRDELARAAQGDTNEGDMVADIATDVTTWRASEMMVVVAARHMARLAVELGLTSILAGVGAANLSAWLALRSLRSAGHPIETMAEIGYFGYEPRPADPYIFNFKNTPTCISTTDILTILGLHVGNGRCLGSLGAAQVDEFGRLNTTCIPDKMHLLGSGGGNDVASTAAAVVVTAYLGPGKFPKLVDYVTSPGDNVRVVVTDRGVFAKPPGAQPLRLLSWYGSGPTGYQDLDTAVTDIRTRVGWDLLVADDIDCDDPPNEDELRVLRMFDPYRQFIR